MMQGVEEDKDMDNSNGERTVRMLLCEEEDGQDEEDEDGRDENINTEKTAMGILSVNIRLFSIPFFFLFFFPSSRVN